MSMSMPGSTAYFWPFELSRACICSMGQDGVAVMYVFV